MSCSCTGEGIVDPFCDPDNPKKIDFVDIASAHVRIRGGIVRTPCKKSKISNMVCMNIYLKNEFMQQTGSFKERGARYAMLMMDKDTRRRGVVAASAGNHAQAVAWHGWELDIPVTVVMPVIAPLMKIQNCKAFQAEVIVQGKNMQESKNIAMKLAKDKGATYLNGYDHPQVLAGQGTVGLEIVEQVPDVDVVVVPVGGGSLIAGVSMALKTLQPRIKIIGVESESCAGFTASLKVGKPVAVEAKPTLADGLAVPLVGYNSVATALDNVDKMIVVKEADIAIAVLRLVELEKFIVEGAGASPLAAVLSGQLNEYKGKNVVLILSGGNIDTTVLGRCLERGLAADGRLVKIYAQVSDKPGGLAELCHVIASLGIGIKHINQERAWVKADVFSVQVKCVCETRDYEHALELEKLLRKNYKQVEFTHADFPASSATNK